MDADFGSWTPDFASLDCTACLSAVDRNHEVGAREMAEAFACPMLPPSHCLQPRLNPGGAIQFKILRPGSKVFTTISWFVVESKMNVSADIQFYVQFNTPTIKVNAIALSIKVHLSVNLCQFWGMPNIRHFLSEQVSPVTANTSPPNLLLSIN
jgi:hypothetical protein